MANKMFNQFPEGEYDESKIALQANADTNEIEYYFQPTCQTKFLSTASLGNTFYQSTGFQAHNIFFTATLAKTTVEANPNIGDIPDGVSGRIREIKATLSIGDGQEVACNASPAVSIFLDKDDYFGYGENAILMFPADATAWNMISDSFTVEILISWSESA